MNSTKKKGRGGKLILTGALALAMAASPVASYLTVPAMAAEKMQFSEEQIVANDYLLYLVNCGTPDASVLPDGYESMGLYQSSVDQRYGQDAVTGLNWGLADDNENMVAVKGGDSATSLTGSYIYTSDTQGTYDAEKSGFLYSFELPDRESDEYLVTVGIDNPWAQWGTKYENIVIEDQLVEERLTAAGFEKEYEVTVTDGELNVFVQATPGTRNDSGGDPVLNYIIIKAEPQYTLEALQIQLDSYKDRVASAEGTFSDASKAAFDEAVEKAQALIDGKVATENEIQSALAAVEEAYAGLKQVYTYTSIPGTAASRIFDNNGNKIQAHGGQVQKIGDTWYWYGEDKTNGYRPVEGVHCYSSTDLYNWKDEGLALDAIEVPDEHYGDDKYVDLTVFENNEELKELYGDYAGQPADDPTYETKLEEVYWNLAEDRCVMERPKVLYNEKNDQYVMWWHCDGRTPTNTADYGKARAGVAVADNPAGPFKFVGTYLLASDPERTDHGFDSQGGHVRDMNVFKDDDGTAYVLYSSEGNEVMYIARLNDSYTGLAKDPEDMIHGEDFATISTDSREAPAMFKYNGMYYLITSGCTGWAPNQAAYAVAEDPMGPWTRMGDPCVGDTDRNTFWTQSTCVIPVDPENGEFIYMGDRWYNPDNGADISDSRYVWLPIEFGSDNTIMIKDYSNWTLDELKGKGAISVDTEFPETTTSVSSLMESLPDTVDVTIGGTEYKETPVEWSMDDRTAALGDYALGDVTVTGDLKELNREFSVTVFNCPASLVYFADCATGTDNPSEIYDRFAEGADDLLNMVSDQAYGNDGGINWGYTSTPGASGAGDSQDMGSHTPGSFYNSGWWATGTGTIDYSFELEPGNYAVMTGYQEWWSSTRGIRITATSVDADGNETEIGTTTFTLSGEQDMQQRTDIAVPEDSDHVIVSISKASGSDPVLSWIGIVSTDEQAEPAAENLVTNGSFEEGATGWSLGNGASVQKGDDAPDGTQYMRDNGDANSWGDGSSQKVAVEPDTEYVLTGSAKVDSSDPYYVGANVDGKEIYAVFSTDDSYTDTTDEAGKLAYEVHAGAADWTDFEIRFTTGAETTSVNVYTWIDSGYGYLDNVVLKEVTGKLDWTEFDALMAEIDAMDKAEYTEESWAEFQTVVAAAKEFKENATDDTKQREIRQMISDLEDAMENLISIHEPTGDVTYYVDAENGNDENDGTSPETAWKTLAKASSIRQLKEGGSILLKAGSVWNGEQLSVKNAKGSEANPIVIGSYGEGAKPVINGQGANWASSTSPKEELAAVHIKNCENIVVENLEITNWDETATPGSGWTYGQSSKLLSGLVVENRDAGELSNVVIRNNEIHDVNGKMAGGADKGAGGLIVLVTGDGANHSGKVESWYNGLTIDGNEVYKVCHEAIYMESVWASRTLVGGTSSDTGYQNAGNGKWIGSSDVVIENNYVHDVAGDGIVPINTTDALVQYNLIDNAADTNWDYSANVNHAALWTWDSDNVTFRYNEAFNSSKDSVGEAMLQGTNDSMAFDFDYGVQNCLYEYNYSHDNYGGFLMLCPGPGATVNNIARYNLSINDGRYDGAPMIRVGGGKYGSNGVQVYNNTMYWEGNGGYAAALAPESNWEGSVVTDVSIFNNIFYGPATSGSVKQSEGVSYYNNLVYSSDGSAQEVYQAAANDENAVYEKPMFKDVADFTTGTWADGKTTLGTADGFMIQKGSPAIDAGAEHPEAPASAPSAVADELVPNETEKPAYDYYGNALADGKNDIGANEYTAEAADKSGLEAAISAAEALDASDYTADSYAAVTEALEAAKAVLADENASQKEVDTAAETLAAAIKELVEAEQPVQVDKSALQALVDEADEKYAEQGSYTDASYSAYLNAMKDAKAVLADENATQEAVHAAAAALAEAIEGLEVVETPSGDDADQIRADLQKLVDSCGKLTQGSFTDSSYKAFTDALASAKAVLADQDATAKELSDAYAALAKAVNGLTVDKDQTTPDGSDAAGSDGTSTAVNGTKTGDSAPIALYTVIVLIAFGAVVSTVVVRRRRRG